MVDAGFIVAMDTTDYVLPLSILLAVILPHALSLCFFLSFSLAFSLTAHNVIECVLSGFVCGMQWRPELLFLLFTGRRMRPITSLLVDSSGTNLNPSDFRASNGLAHRRIVRLEVCPVAGFSSEPCESRRNTMSGLDVFIDVRKFGVEVRLSALFGCY